MRIITLRGLLGIFILFVILTNSLTAQRTGDVSKKNKISAISLRYICDEAGAIRLGLENETNWALGVLTDSQYYNEKIEVTLENGRKFSALPSHKNVSLQYRIDKFARPEEQVKIPKISYPDSGSLSWIAPTSSIQFVVPKKYLTEYLLVFVRFNYEWELPDQGSFSTSPEHRLSLRGIDLPDKRIPCDK
ncbi:MAG: hypothetical protein AB7W44_01065 [Pyrinomonadaceae bacterium]